MAFAPITMNLQEELTDQLEIATWKEFTIGGVHITIDECNDCNDNYCHIAHSKP